MTHFTLKRFSSKFSKDLGPRDLLQLLLHASVASSAPSLSSPPHSIIINTLFALHHHAQHLSILHLAVEENKNSATTHRKKKQKQRKNIKEPIFVLSFLYLSSPSDVASLASSCPPPPTGHLQKKKNETAGERRRLANFGSNDNLGAFFLTLFFLFHLNLQVPSGL